MLPTYPSLLKEIYCHCSHGCQNYSCHIKYTFLSTNDKHVGFWLCEVPLPLSPVDITVVEDVSSDEHLQVMAVPKNKSQAINKIGS